MISYELGNHVFINTDCISEQSLCLMDLGLEIRTNETYYFENKTRDFKGYLFQYTLEGEGIYEHNGLKHKLSKGKAFLITFPENSLYYLPKNHGVHSHWTFFYIHFSGPSVEPFYNRIRELSGPVIELDINSSSIKRFFDLYSVLQKQKQLPRYGGSEWLYGFLVSVLKNVEYPPMRKPNPYVADAILWIKMNYAKQINLMEWSKEMGISYAHLSRQFSLEQGISPMQFLTNVRIEHGKELLLNTNLSMEKIAEECGFSCANYFTKVYKKVLHITPSEYRKLHKL